MVRTPASHRGSGRLTAVEQRTRACRIRLVLSDVDGVLTDTGVYYSANGEEFYRFSRRDGMGADLLRAEGIETGIITSEDSAIIRRRAEKLGLRHIYLGIKDKHRQLSSILQGSGLTTAEIAYIGDDVNDLGIIHAVSDRGLTAAPWDAVEAVQRVVHHRCKERGGFGAFRDFAEWILTLRKKG